MYLNIETVGATQFLALLDKAISQELAEAAQAYIETNMVEFGRFQESMGAKDTFSHVVTFARGRDENILGFRYFFFEPHHRLCHLFATFVDASCRRQGVAARLINESFAFAVGQGCTDFEIRLTKPTDEKDGLFLFYRKMARTHQDRFRFTIYYWKRMERYGYV